jgi:DNA replication and repair protein RecF
MVMENLFSKKERIHSAIHSYFQYTSPCHTGSQETVQLVYESHLFENNLLTLLQENINKDRAHTSVGTHKDDLSFEIDGTQLKKIRFPGTAKSFLIALKLAQFEFLKQSGVNPFYCLMTYSIS